MRQIKVSASAKEDFKLIRSYVVRKFSAADWNHISNAWQINLNKIAKNPELGSGIPELEDTGYNAFKKYHYKNVYVVYSFSATELEIHMFIPSMRDFRAHLLKRLLNQ